jgi:hypothetical protein
VQYHHTKQPGSAKKKNLGGGIKKMQRLFGVMVVSLWVRVVGAELAFGYFL